MAAHRISTIIGVAIILIYIFMWMLRTEPVHQGDSPLRPAAKMAISLLLCALAVYGGWLHASHIHYRRIPEITPLGVFAVTATAVLWWELVALGWLWRKQYATQPERAALSASSIRPAEEAVPAASLADRHRRSRAAAPPAR